MKLDPETVRRAVRIDRYISQYVKLKRDGKDLMGLCPFHHEKTPSFKVHPAEGYFKCFGCGAGGDVIEFAKLKQNLGFQEALQAVAEFGGITGGPKPLRRVVAPPAPRESASEETSPRGPCVATYTYTDPDGEYLFEVHRHEPGKNGRKKDFSQGYRNSTGKMIWKAYPEPVLYRLPAVIAAEEVFLVEGEKDAETVERLGYVGTTPPGGSSAVFTADMITTLAGKTVYLMPDNDGAGQKRGQQLASSLKDIALSVIHFPSKVGKDITDWAEAAGDEQVKAAIEQFRTDTIRERLKGPLTIAEIIQRYPGGYEAFCDPGRRPKGIQTGFAYLDRMTRGMFASQLVVLAARPGMGKTAFGMNIAVNVCRAGVPVTVFSLEMSSDDLLTRMVCGDSEISTHAFGLNYVNKEDKRNFARCLNMLAELPIKIDDQSAASLEYIRLHTEKHKPGLVVVDYLGLMSAKKAESRVLQVGELTAGLKSLAKDLRIPVLLVAQLNRSTETRPSGGNIPLLSDLRESGSIEQDADMVWFVYRPEYYKPDREELRGQAEIIIAKNRGGPLGKVKLNWLGKFTKFVNPTNIPEIEAGGYLS